VSPGIFPVASDSSMCPGVDSASKNEYQDNPGGKGGRCVRLTTYHFHVPIVKKSGDLNLLEACRLVQACNGTALPYYYIPFVLSHQNKHILQRSGIPFRPSAHFVLEGCYWAEILHLNKEGQIINCCNN
jgi:hypothetical protein